MLIEDVNQNKIDGTFVVVVFSLVVKLVHCKSFLSFEENPV